MTDITWADKDDGGVASTPETFTADDANQIKQAVAAREKSTELLAKLKIGDVSVLTPAATITLDCATVSAFTLAIDQNTLLANPTNLSMLQTVFLLITQDATARTLSVESDWKFPGGVPNLSEDAGAVDLIIGTKLGPNFIAANILNGFT